jgi:hypothetical protein
MRSQGQNPSDITWQGAIALQFWSAELEDRQLEVTLAWQPQINLERDYTAFVHLLREDGTLIGQMDRQPEGYPTTDWRQGEVVIDRFNIELPPDLPPDDYILQTGFYHLPSSERLGNPAFLGTFTIQ